jgi:CheY-like chemotaxis protein
MERASPVADLVYRQNGPLHQVVLDVAGIHRIVYDRQRFSEIAVVIADWHMPEMGGLDMLQRMPLRNIGRILLTGRADQATALRAFNHGEIDRFVEKAGNSAIAELQAAVNQLQLSYFRRNFSLITDTLTVGDFRFLRDPTIVDILQNQYVSIEAIEMYVHDVPKGLLFLDAKGTAEFVMIMSPDELFQHAENADRIGAPEEIRRALRDGSLLPVFNYGSPTFDQRTRTGSVDFIAGQFVRGHTGEYYLGKLRSVDRFRPATINSFDAWLRDVESQYAPPEEPDRQ